MLLCNKVDEFFKYEAKEKKNKLLFNMKKNSLIGSLKNEWVDIMANLGLYNHVGNTYSLNNINITDYGFKGDIFKVNGLSYNSLQDKLDVIQENLGCMIALNFNRNSQWINFKMIYKVNRNKGFEIIKQGNPFELHIGNDYSGNPILVDLKGWPHLLISGGTRSGKSVLMDIILTNLICNTSPQQVSLYLCQIAKDDLVLYEDIIHTRAYADTLDKIKVVLEYLVYTLIPLRNNLIKPYRKRAMVNNYHDYNNLSGVNKLETIYVCFDEMSSLYDKKGGTKESQTLKTQIGYLIDEIARMGASLGVFLMCSLQRPTADNLSTMVKAQSTINISFRQNNSKSSEVATDDASLALGLKQREFVYKDSEWKYGVVPIVDHKKLYEHLKPYVKPNHRTLFDDLDKLANRDGVKKNKEKVKPKEDHSHLIHSEKEILEKNIAKIPNYVPYQKEVITTGKEKIS